jgi:hypothetical protein
MEGEKVSLLVVHVVGQSREPRALGWQIVLVGHLGHRWVSAKRQADG